MPKLVDNYGLSPISIVDELTSNLGGVTWCPCNCYFVGNMMIMMNQTIKLRSVISSEKMKTRGKPKL